MCPHEFRYYKLDRVRLHFGGAILGMWLRRVLPERHLSADSKDSIKVGMALVGTMTALVPGLLLASAKGAYDAQTAELISTVRQFCLARPSPCPLRTRDQGCTRSVERYFWADGRSSLVKRSVRSCALGSIFGCGACLRQNSSALNEGRCAALAQAAGIECCSWPGTNALVDV